MSTSLFNEGQLYIQQFWGGKERGISLQIGTGTPDGAHYIGINREELEKILPVLQEWLKNQTDEKRREDRIRQIVMEELEALKK